MKGNILMVTSNAQQSLSRLGIPGLLVLEVLSVGSSVFEPRPLDMAPHDVLLKTHLSSKAFNFPVCAGL